MPCSFSRFFFLFTTVFLLVNCLLSHAQNNSEVANENDEKLAHFWRSVNLLAEKSADNLGSLANYVEEIAFYLDRGSSKCYQLVEYVLRNGLHEEVAARMIHANSFLSENVLISRIADPEHFAGQPSVDSSAASCLSMVSKQVPEHWGLFDGNATFDGQFCLTKFSIKDFNETQSLRLKNESTISYFERAAQRWILNRRQSLLIGICVPSICEVEELEMLIGKYFENFLGHIELKIVHCQSKNMENIDAVAHWLLILAVCIALFAIILNLLSTFGYYLVKRSLPSNSYWKNVIFRLTCCFHLGGNVRKQFEQSVPSKTNVYCSNYFYGCKTILVGLIVYENCRIASEGTSVGQKVLLAAFFFICGLVKFQSLIAKPKFPSLTVCLFFTWLKFELLACFVFLCTILLRHLEIGFRLTEENCCLSEWLLQVLLIDNFFFYKNFRALFLSSLFQLHLLNCLMCFVFLSGKAIISYIILIATVIGCCTLTALVDLPVTMTFAAVSYLLGVLFVMLNSKFGITFKRKLHLKTFLSQHFFLVFDRLSYCALGVNLLLLDLNLRALTPWQKSRFNNIQLFTLVYSQSLILSFIYRVLLQTPLYNLLALLAHLSPKQPTHPDADRFSNLAELRKHEYAHRNGIVVNMNVIA